jgi:hypothetical protein
MARVSEASDGEHDVCDETYPTPEYARFLGAFAAFSAFFAALATPAAESGAVWRLLKSVAKSGPRQLTDVISAGERACGSMGAAAPSGIDGTLPVPLAELRSTPSDEEGGDDGRSIGANQDIHLSLSLRLTEKPNAAGREITHA